MMYSYKDGGEDEVGQRSFASQNVATLTKKHQSILGRSAPVLPWMRVPLTIHSEGGILLEDIGNLDPRLMTSLKSSAKIEVLFPVQCLVWKASAGGSSNLHDICLAAPTGSGKTLAYSLPVLQSLSKPTSMPHSLQALIILPTSDLVLQVYSVLYPLCDALDIQCCTASGVSNISIEADAIQRQKPRLLIATPGRLIAHLESTPGFTLYYLKFLVIDEADRLLRQAYQNWLTRIRIASTGVDCEVTNNHRVVKFVVSATLTKDPSKLDRLDLYNPRYIAMAADDHRYKLPRGLEEQKYVVAAQRKPHALIALLSDVRNSPTIVFTSSIESTHKLASLLRGCHEIIGNTVEYSAAIPSEERRAALEAFRSKHATVIVCSDAMTRGMDVEGVEIVINYDAPVYVKTYVHRAGRTARAGRQGRVVTLLRHEDVRHFKSMLHKADNTYVKDITIDKEKYDYVAHWVEAALATVQMMTADNTADKVTPQFLKRSNSAAHHGDDAIFAQNKNKRFGAKKLGNVPEINFTSLAVA